MVEGSTSEEDSSASREGSSAIDGWRVALIAALGIAISGLSDFLLASRGYAGLGGLVWASGFGFTVLVVWYLWLRPMELTGPDG